MEEVTKKIRDLEKSHKVTADQETLRELTITREQLREMYYDKARSMLVKFRRNFYEYGNKNSRLLAFSIRFQRTKSFIPCIKTQEGRTYLPTEIAIKFEKYYFKLYNLDSQGNQRGGNWRKKRNGGVSKGSRDA